MEETDFKEQVLDQLKGLSRKDIARFAGLCALRALPFLGVTGSFNYWKTKSRKKYLYAVFYAIDSNWRYVNSGGGVDGAAAYTAADDDAYTADDAAHAADAAAAYATDVTYAAYAAAYAAYAAYAATHAAAATDNTTAVYAIYAATNATAVYFHNDTDLRNIILQDIQSIKKGIALSNTDTAIYGPLWKNFQDALANEGCAYWREVYEHIFANGLTPDNKELERRMSVPPEIRSEGAVVVADYLKAMEEGASRLNEARIVILGDKGAGKTCLARRLVNPSAPMTSPEESTPGVETSLWKLKKGEEEVNVHIWDFARHTITHAVHRFFLSERCVYIVVYDGRTDSEYQLEYWLNHVKNYGGDSKVFILVNRKDNHNPDICINTLKRQYPSIAEVYDFSIDTDNVELEKFRNAIADYIRSNPSWNQQIPDTYFRVKEALEDLFTKGDAAKNEELITIDKFNRIAHENGIEDTTDLLNNLHNLGICLWYKNIEKYNILILNPEWISYGVYKIINWVHEQKSCSVLLTDFRAVFQGDSRYPEKHYPFLFKLMQQYELAYETANKPCLIIPYLMDEDSPAELPEFPIGESLMLRYKSEQPLPLDTISRFIVRHNQDIKQDTGTNKPLVWRYGVVLEDKNGNIALVMEEDRTISVSVKGKDKTTYLTTLRVTLNDIFDTYQSKKPDLEYHVKYGEKATASANEKPLWLPDNQIYNWAQANRPYYDDRTQQDINLQQYIINYNINYGTLIAGTGNVIDKSIHTTTLNFYNCNITMQGLLTELANELKKNGKVEEAEDLEEAKKDLEEIKKLANPEEIETSGKLDNLQRVLRDLADENSTLYKVVKGIHNGRKIVGEILGVGVKIMQFLV